MIIKGVDFNNLANMLPDSHLDQEKIERFRGVIVVDEQKMEALSRNVGAYPGSNFVGLTNKQTGEWAIVRKSGCPEQEIPYGILHEVTELRALVPPESVVEIAQRTQALFEPARGKLSEATMARITEFPHLLGVAAERVAAYCLGGTEELSHLHGRLADDPKNVEFSISTGIVRTIAESDIVPPSAREALNQIVRESVRLIRAHK